MPPPEKRSDFMDTLLVALVRSFAEEGQRDDLVALLSAQVVDGWGGYFELEWYLASREGKKLKDPILVLGDAYAKSRTPEVAKDLAKVIRRAFKGLDIPGKDDAEYANAAMRWYAANRDHLVVNPKYVQNSLNAALFGRPYRLFIEKEKSLRQEHDPGRGEDRGDRGPGDRAKAFCEFWCDADGHRAHHRYSDRGTDGGGGEAAGTQQKQEGGNE
jgi:hypothetical protein